MKINVNFDKLQHIVHIADVHIRLFRRHEEYEIVFDRLYKDIRSKQLKNFVIVLAGDIVHAKTDMSPEMIEVTSAFLRNIADIAPTILIAGNHDCNLANPNRLDSLTPIVNNLGHPSLYYLKDSSVAYVADTAFAVCSIFDSPDHWPTADELDPEVAHKIALYHGPVHGATTDTGFIITNEHVRIKSFNGFDMVLLGDIHRFQCLQNYSETFSRPIIQYAGSLVQQNHGESLTGHGWCLWDVPDRTVELHEIENDFGYVTVEVVNGTYTLPPKLPKNIRMRLFTGDLTPTEANNLISTLKSNYNIIELSVNKHRTKKSIVRTSNIKLKELADLSDVNTQNELISDWISRNDHTVTASDLETILSINKELNTKVSHDDQSRNIHWKPIKFTFDNMFSYGENNEINFDSMKGIYGIFAPNASGKSSIMDSLMFCLYDKTPRAFKGDHILNNRRDKFQCELIFEINNETYGISRVGTRKKNGDVKVDVDFWKVENDVKISLNAEDRRTTNAIIRNYVGSYEDFVMTTMSGQLGTSLFIDKSHSERKDLLNQFMGLNVFDKLNDLANVELKEINTILKRSKKLELTDEIATVTKELNTSKTSLELTTHQAKQLETKRDALIEKLTELQQKRISIPAVNKSITELRHHLNEKKAALKQKEEQLFLIDTSIEKAESEREIVSQDLEQYDLVALKQSIDKIRSFEALLISHNADIRHISTKIDGAINLRSKLQAYEYNPDCTVCAKNNKSVIEELNTVNSEIDQLYANKLIEEGIVTEILKNIEELADDKEDYNNAQTLTERLSKIDQSLENFKIRKETYLSDQYMLKYVINSTKNEIEIYNENANIIEHNNALNNQINGSINPEIMSIKMQLLDKEKAIRTLIGDVKVLETKLEDLHLKLKEVDELEAKARIYSLYMDAIGRDGIPYEIIGKTIPLLEDEINALLAQIVEFRVSLEVDGKNINSRISYDDERIWPLENGSGMERFVSGLAIRVALLNASNLPKPNLLVIDEGFAALDAEHLNSIQTLFNMMKPQFDFMIIISHLESMRDMVDHIIEIKKEDGYSSINI
jgi:DNA repair exonuclease SbcCD ATPase subunit